MNSSNQTQDEIFNYEDAVEQTPDVTEVLFDNQLKTSERERERLDFWSYFK